MAVSPELEALRARLRAREGKPGFADNVADLRKRIAELERAGG